MKEYDKFTEEQAVGRCVTLDNGMEYSIGKIGEGEPCGEGKKVKVNYEMITDSGPKPGTMIDASMAPLEFTLGKGSVIEGWEIILPEMRKGEQRNVRIPANLAYGSEGRSPGVGPNESLVFNIELADYE